MILLATPAYGGQVDTDYVTAILEFKAMCPVPMHEHFIKNESLIPRARNNLLSYFHWHEEYSHILFIDSDIYISAQDIYKMWMWHKDVIGAPVRLGSEQVIYNFNATSMIHPEYEQGKRLLKVDRIGTGVFMLSRKAVSALVENAINEGNIYGRQSVLSGGAMVIPEVMFDICKVGITEDHRHRNLMTRKYIKGNDMQYKGRYYGEQGIYFSEDYSMNETVRDLGFDIWADLTAMCRHNKNMAISNEMFPLATANVGA